MRISATARVDRLRRCCAGLSKRLDQDSTLARPNGSRSMHFPLFFFGLADPGNIRDPYVIGENPRANKTDKKLRPFTG